MWSYKFDKINYEIIFYYNLRLSSYWKIYDHSNKSLLEIKKNLSSYVISFSKDILDDKNISMQDYLIFIDTICTCLKEIQNI